MERLFVVLKRYVSLKSSNENFLQLFISKRLIHGSATALMGVFVPIFLYTTAGEDFLSVGLFFLISSILYLIFLVPGTQFMNRFGTRIALVISGIFSTIYFSILYFMDSVNFLTLLIPLLIAITFFRIFHWVPYFIDFTVFTRDGERGRDVGLTYATIAFLGIIGPILAGYIISNSGYNVLFAIAVVLLLLATASYALVPAVDEKFEWGYRETWNNMFAKEYRPMTLASFANGLESSIATIAWPIFLYEILEGNVLEIGALATLITGVTILIQLIVGSRIDSNIHDKVSFLRVGSSLYALGWVIKIFVLSAFQIFFAGLYHNITKIFTKTSYDTILWDMSADQGHYVDEFSVLRELAAHSGKVISISAIIVLTLFIPIQWTFVIGASASLLLNVIYRAVND